MTETKYINVDIAKVRIPDAKNKVLAWGDKVKVIKETKTKVEIRVYVPN